MNEVGRYLASPTFILAAALLLMWFAVTIGTNYFGLPQPWGYVVQVAGGPIIGIAAARLTA